jgi:2,5-diamino-6-(ribosylamino)-4(3H)-pyrimidinone 5'-phosphate reductase
MGEVASLPVPVGSRTHVWVNCAVSLDGRLALAGGARLNLSGPEDLARVHRIRAASDAILVGVGTVALDDPSLRVHWDLLGETPRRPPTRIVVDSSGRTPLASRVLDGSIPTIVATTERNRREYPPHVHRLVVGRDTVDLALLFVRLRERGMERVMVEGGARILASVARDLLFDRWTVYTAPVVVGSGSAPAMIEGPAAATAEDAARFRLEAVEPLGEGYVATYSPRRAMPTGSPSKR